jgi:hypothetical protein
MALCVYIYLLMDRPDLAQTDLDYLKKNGQDSVFVQLTEAFYYLKTVILS